MKSYSNKSAKAKSKVVKTTKDIGSKDTASKPSYRVEEISNGFVVEKSWSDQKGYHCSKTYSETNPLEG